MQAFIPLHKDALSYSCNPTQLQNVPHLLVARNIDMRKFCHPVLEAKHHGCLRRRQACWCHKVMFLQTIYQGNWKLTVNNVSFSNYNQPVWMIYYRKTISNRLSVAFVIAEFPAHPPEQKTLSFYNSSITYKPWKIFAISRPQRNAICISLDFAIKAGAPVRLTWLPLLCEKVVLLWVQTAVVFLLIEQLRTLN